MDQTIWKYPLRVKETETFLMPRGAEILTIQVQNETPCIWALVDPNETYQDERKFEIHGTGNPILLNDSTKRKYIGSFQLMEGQLVFHLFELINH